MIPPSLVSIGILAGGRASRLAGADKASQLFRGKTLLARTLDAIDGDGCAILLSHPGLPVPPDPRITLVPDLRGGQPGPLAGWEALMTACTTPWLLTVPVDLRTIPAGLPERLSAGLGNNAGEDGAILRDADGMQWLVGLWRVATLLPRVQRALAGPDRSVKGLLAGGEFVTVDVRPWRLGNLNTPEDFLVPGEP